jgi:hypothetical protein
VADDDFFQYSARPWAEGTDALSCVTYARPHQVQIRVRAAAAVENRFELVTVRAVIKT